MKKVLLVLMLLISLVGCSNSSSDDGKFTVGVIQLVKHDALDNATKGFEDVLKEKYGDKVNVDIQLASGDSATCLLIANNFVADEVKLIMCNATPALQATAQATSTIPVLGTSVTEYGVALNIKDFNGTVGGNISGTSDLAPLDQQAKMIIDLLPTAKKIGLLYCSSEDNSKYQVEVVEKYLLSKGLEVTRYAFDSTSTLDATAQAACEESDALYIPTDNTCADNGGTIAKYADEYNTPIIAGEKSILEKTGGLATLSIDYYELGRTTGEMAIKIIEGKQDISTMPIEYYEDPIQIISEKAANKFGITIPEGYETVEG